MTPREQTWRRFTAVLGSLGLCLAVSSWSCSTESFVADGGNSGGRSGNGSGGNGSGGNGSGGSGAGGSGGGASETGGQAGMSDAGADRAASDGPGSCPVLNDPAAPPPVVNTSTWVGARGIIPIPFMIAFDATFSWTATDAPGQTGAGTFDDPTSSFTTFRCTRAGDVTITVHLGLPNTSCDMPTSWVVRCQL